nr:NAD-dependent epimerase/dehydratase family protein [Rhodospirillales bacterium]
MPDKTSILVTGASGRTGRAVISALKMHDVTIRGYIRRREVAQELKTLGVDEIVLGDLFDFSVLERAVSGCGHVIHICPPMNPRETELAAKVTDLCLKHGVRRQLLYSVLHPLLSDVRHHNLKLKAEEYLVNSGQTYTILQPGRYMQHHVPIWKEIMETGRHRMPFSVDAKFNIVDLADLAEAVANVLTGDGHASATYQLAGPQALNQIDMARIISEVTGKSIASESKPADEFRAG